MSNAPQWWRWDTYWGVGAYWNALAQLKPNTYVRFYGVRFYRVWAGLIVDCKPPAEITKAQQGGGNGTPQA